MTEQGKKLWDKMEVVTLSIVCRKGDGESIADEMMGSEVSQRGIYSIGTEIREVTSYEVNEVIAMTPKDIIDDYFAENKI
ncbi:MAG: hypothetical protein J7L15_08385 [Clostridiales bacterium]|nr:hypothetical protein [Clostridiales bacterium]